MVHGLKRILVVHAEQIIRDWMFVSLHQAGYKVRKATGLSDVRRLNDEGKLYALNVVVTGFTFGKDQTKEGLAVASFFQELNPDLPLVLYLPSQDALTETRKDYLSVFDPKALKSVLPNDDELKIFAGILREPMTRDGKRELLATLDYFCPRQPFRCDPSNAQGVPFVFRNFKPIVS